MAGKSCSTSTSTIGSFAAKTAIELASQPCVVPLTVADLEQETADRFIRSNLEVEIESLVGSQDSEIVLQHQERLAHRLDDCVRVATLAVRGGARLLDLDVEANVLTIAVA